ncbi:hypothetical protein C1645_812157 [Glomus cerebriforme]|uniref:Uncharacterized protein n=1 Tax=Glomus cerebriforme TaxID=658196 RepID=A0A397TVF9_9GLOM|nr:hypothetical protein C1645_812157 [Glomus cerebriforme]
MKLLKNLSYIIKFPPRDIIGSKPQQHVSVAIEASSNISDHSDHTSSLNSAGDGSGSAGSGGRRRGQFPIETSEFSNIDWNSIDFVFITNY